MILGVHTHVPNNLFRIDPLGTVNDPKIISATFLGTFLETRMFSVTFLGLFLGTISKVISSVRVGIEVFNVTFLEEHMIRLSAYAKCTSKLDGQCTCIASISTCYMRRVLSIQTPICFYTKIAVICSEIIPKNGPGNILGIDLKIIPNCSQSWEQQYISLACGLLTLTAYVFGRGEGDEGLNM